MIFMFFGTLNAFGPFLSQSKSSEYYVCEIPNRFDIFFMVHKLSQTTDSQFHGGSLVETFSDQEPVESIPKQWIFPDFLAEALL